jgi:hypothetical protein
METKQPGCCGGADSRAFFDVELSYGCKIDLIGQSDCLLDNAHQRTKFIPPLCKRRDFLSGGIDSALDFESWGNV